MDNRNKEKSDSSHEKTSLLRGMVRLARPKHWIKNIFILIPLPFAWIAARNALHADPNATVTCHFDLVVLLLGMAGFSLINSAVYTLNDMFDAKADREHPRKRERPIAAGVVPVKAAVAQIAVLTILGLSLAAATGSAAALEICGIYIFVNLIYTLGAKHIALLDVFLLSSGFTLRVLFGVALVGSAPSAWLLLCSSALALFLGFTKRRGDLAAGVDCKHRPSLKGYTLSFLDHAMLICAGVALLAYALYSIEAKVFSPGREMVSLPFVAYGILNYLRLAETENAGDSPVEMAYSSRSSQICAVCWLIAVLWSLGIW